jgi:hypothetical protein
MRPRYREAGVLTGPGRHAPAVGALYGDVGLIIHVVQGLFLHEDWADAYGVTLTAADRETVHLRRAAEMLDAVLERDDRPLSEPRTPDLRVVTSSRGFATVAVALLRAHDVSARARCGFATYLSPGVREEHWLVEYVEPHIHRWQFADAQLDTVQRTTLGVRLPVLDIREGRWFDAGPSAWWRIRNGADAGEYRSRAASASGVQAVAAAAMRDIACLDDAICLPWDRWEPMPGPEDPVDMERFDAIAMGGEHVHPPEYVHNSRRGRMERLHTDAEPQPGPCRALNRPATSS